MTIPIYIIAYNNLYFVRHMVEQLEKYTKDIHIIDNASTFPKLLEYYRTEYKYDLIQMDKNYGSAIHVNGMYSRLPDKFIITDPDLELNKDLPMNFIEELDMLSEKYKMWKVGFALDISDFDKMFQDSDYMFGRSIYDFESQYWTNKVGENLYNAPIDTTFCLCNKKYFGNQWTPAMRVAGNYTAKHLQWYKETWMNYPRDELDYYNKSNISSIILKFVNRMAFVPRLHFLLMTIGRKTIFRMIDSIVSQFDNTDYLTIIYDGKDVDNTYNDVIKYKDKYKNINIIMEPVNTGFWGHGLRNKYNTLEGDFVMHCDDDDMYLPNAVNTIKKTCVNPDKLYIYKFINIDGSVIDGKIEVNHIGSPSGIIPTKYNNKSKWEYTYIGDYLFYKNLPIDKLMIEFHDEIIHMTRPHNENKLYKY